ncbi:cysteine-rich receptor-like protein kinase 6 [Pyrus ussuriensis x Pyrus communis]|uniref:Cysteine-rich receptor-like protein kinase 6 n=1 Tax=Pyrus ussuriensis x Pyrus communis TaxID=2448454 RepID=A0A5N5IA17_9ROSA|nr:cysteine-rich receptor-like protein kinase 6 [Pyrus ussuriensis x Pyrus communis]
MIPFYVLSLLLIALPSTTTDVVPIVIANTPSSQTPTHPTTVIANTPSSQTPTHPTTVIANTPSSQTSTPTATLSPSPPPMLSPSPPPPSLTNRSGSSKSSSMLIIVGTLGSVAFCSLVVGCFFRKRLGTVKERYHSKRQKKKVSNDMKTTVESLQFRLGTIETATNKFSDDNKLGEGGFGAVFKGTLGNGQEIAVKWLSKSSTRGVPEFQNEVVLVAKLQHGNLVRLLGFCMEGEETLLVYEYVPNKSLDKFLFEPKKREQLDWSRRCMIIGGIAREILYLYEDSRLRVIHRDLKASNILLDGEMNPKISDFGMTKMFGVDDQTQGNTERVVGTELGNHGMKEKGWI